MDKKANHFSGQLGFVLAAAGSAVGVGNLWRFPYLAAKDGGGRRGGRAVLRHGDRFATLTSCISVLESITAATGVEIFHWERKKAVRILIESCCSCGLRP